jgi:hypothetical protein
MGAVVDGYADGDRRALSSGRDRDAGAVSMSEMEELIRRVESQAHMADLCGVDVLLKPADAGRLVEYVRKLEAQNGRRDPGNEDEMAGRGGGEEGAALGLAVMALAGVVWWLIR